MLQRHAAIKKLDLDICVIESSRIPTVGVGEGTTAVFRQVLIEQLGINEREFVRKTGAAFKFGIRHKDWRRKGYTYDAPIDDPNLLAQSQALSPAEQASALDIYAVSTGRPLAEIHLFGQLMAKGKSPFILYPDGEFVRAAPYEHSFHFDQARVGAFLHEQAEGVRHIDAEVAGVRKNGETGDIEAVLLKEGGEVTADFFIDCTGFRRKLICEGMGAKWTSYQDTLPVNRAMPFWIEHDETTEIAPYTRAWAQEAGWMWSIATQDRIGCGYVYSDQFRTPETAKEEVERVLGRKIEPRNDIKIDSGRLDRAWIGNCLALGLSSSFLEPLESTSIHGTIVQVMLFTQFCLDSAFSSSEKTRQRYNDAVASQLTDFQTFINLHYVGEREEPFWQYVRQNCIHEATRQRMEHWSRSMPRRTDFPPFPGNLPHINEQLYYPVLDGLGHLSREVARAHMAERPKVRSHARKITDAHVKEYTKISSRCLGHREYLRLVTA